jgi:uncharacterized protein (DUF3084 family)
MTSETSGHRFSQASSTMLKRKYDTTIPARISRTRRIGPTTAETVLRAGALPFAPTFRRFVKPS